MHVFTHVPFPGTKDASAIDLASRRSSRAWRRLGCDHLSASAVPARGPGRYWGHGPDHRNNPRRDSRHMACLHGCGRDLRNAQDVSHHRTDRDGRLHRRVACGQAPSSRLTRRSRRGQRDRKYRSAHLQRIGSNGPFHYITAAPRAFSLTSRITQRDAGTGHGRSGPPPCRRAEPQPAWPCRDVPGAWPPDEVRAAGDSGPAFPAVRELVPGSGTCPGDRASRTPMSRGQ